MDSYGFSSFTLCWRINIFTFYLFFKCMDVCVWMLPPQPLTISTMTSVSPRIVETFNSCCEANRHKVRFLSRNCWNVECNFHTTLLPSSLSKSILDLFCLFHTFTLTFWCSTLVVEISETSIEDDDHFWSSTFSVIFAEQRCKNQQSPKWKTVVICLFQQYSPIAIYVAFDITAVVCILPLMRDILEAEGNWKAQRPNL